MLIYSIQIGDLSIHVEDTQSLSDFDIRRTENVLWDVLARKEGMGECAKCTNCNILLSKEDIFSRHTEISVVKKYTPGELFELYRESLCCAICKNKIKFIHPPSVKACIDTSIASTLITCRDTSMKIIGGLFTYITDFDTAYHREFQAHYSHTHKREIEKSLIQKFGKIPEQLIVFSSIGILEPYNNNIMILYQMLTLWARYESIMDHDFPGIAEMDSNNTLYMIARYTGMDILDLGCTAQNTSPYYKSQLIIHKNPIRAILEKTKMGVLPFLKDILKHEKT